MHLNAAPVQAVNTPLERLVWGTDASFYRLVPEEVLAPADEAGVARILERARREGKKVTFRAAGTSLSGQASTDSLLVVCGKKWERFEVLDGGRLIRVQPGLTGGRVNEILKPYGRKFTPDPASIASAMVGGIVANNASGMCCGTHANAERMIRSARLVLADGTILDTGDAASRAAFAQSHPQFLARLAELRDRVRNDPELKALILRKYRLKNVTGITILPLAEFEDLFEIVTRLVPGSEGTLAFLAEATFETGEIEALERSELRLYPTARAACEAVAELARDPRVVAAEFFDRAAMRAVEKDFPELAAQPDDAGALLVKIRGEAETDPARAAKWWAIRSGIFPAVGATREVGTTCLIEDVAVPVERLADFTDDLKRLFAEHRYPDAVIYGHALAGNWHFILNQRFDTPAAVKQYADMMRAVVDLVTEKYGGSLKAEHGTGRNMAPFVRKEWGDKAYRLMCDVKALFDPEGILAPGVVFNEDPASFVEHLKPLPKVHPLVDRCIECGFCEVNCVACGFSLSSRQRIVAQREIARLNALAAQGDAAAKRRAAALEKDFRRLGRDLCAGDGLCATSCPVKINAGEFVHAIREREQSVLNRRFGAFAAAHFASVAAGVKSFLYAAAIGHRVLGTGLMAAVCRGLHRFLGVPLWTPAMPEPRAGGLPAPRKDPSARRRVVYYPSCINQRMGKARGDAGKTLVDDVAEVLAKAGYEVVYPENLSELCCGLMWESKGMPDVADRKTAELEAALRKASEDGKWPIVCDQSPCLLRLRTKIKGLALYEPAEFIASFVLDKLAIRPVDACVALHVTCSTRKMGLADALVKVARACARDVVLPEGVGCCAFAGDKGFTEPELNAWALRKLRSAIEASGATRGYSNSRTCEIGLTTHGGIPYKGIAALVNEASENGSCA
ncbi:MAG: FAD-binding oxidoreductase [Kiritimatiellae bacterium]|nr:FAD-binding oxidoreductase [Kiritimatiellia bacterium]